MDAPELARQEARNELIALRKERDRLDARIRHMESLAGEPYRGGAEDVAEELLAVVSHELRTPLHVLLGYVTMLTQGWSGPITEVQREQLGTMRQTVEHLTRLVNDLLDMSQIRAGALSLEPVPIELMGLLSDALVRMSPLVTSKRLKVVTQLPAELPVPVADERRIHQVLLNLLSNAVKFTPEGGRITVRVAAEPGYMRLEVTDTGIGIPIDQCERIFERFKQADMGTRRKAGGTGLGLSIAKALVEAHGGMIGVASVTGQGSTFWFTLPCDTKGALGPG